MLSPNTTPKQVAFSGSNFLTENLVSVSALRRYVSKRVVVCIQLFVFAGAVTAQNSNVTISNGSTANGVWIGSGPYIFTPTNNNAVVNITEIEDRLIGNTPFTAGSVTIVTTNTTGTQAGDIDILNDITPHPTSNTGVSFTVTAAAILQIANNDHLIFTGAPVGPTLDSINGLSVNFNGAEVIILGDINTSGSDGGSSSGNGGHAGNISITATAGNVRSTDNITADGGNVSSGIGGNGGAITVTSSSGLTMRDDIEATAGPGGTHGSLTVSNTDTVISNGGTNDGETVGNIISGGLSFTKLGPGRFEMEGINTYTGTTYVNEGVLNIRNSLSVGTSSGGVVVASGASLELENGISVANEALTITGEGFSLEGALRSMSGNNSWSGPITLTGAVAEIDGDIGTLTLSATNAITGSGTNLIMGGTGNTVVTGIINIGSGTFTKKGVGDLTVDDMTVGSITHNGGALHLGAGSIVTGDFVVNAGTISSTSDTLHVSGNITNNGIFTHNNGTVELNGGTQSLGNVELYDLIITGSGPVSLNADEIIDNQLVLNTAGLGINGHTLTLSGGFSRSASNGLIGSTTSNLIIGGSGTLGTLYFDQTSAATMSLNNLTINRSSQTITLGNKLRIIGTITPTAGTLSLTDTLVLVSNASGTARIAAGGASYLTTTGAGRVMVQTYIPAVARRWRFVGSGITSSTIADWQNEIFITGTGGSANGFDETATNNPGVYFYDESLITGDLNTGWESAGTTGDPLVIGRGYRIFVRGDRSDTGRLDGTVSSQNAVTLDVMGLPNQGDISAPVSFTSSGNLADDGWCLLANPYPSAYHWDAQYDANIGIDTAKFEANVWTYSAETGGYISYNAKSDVATGLSGGIIPPGSAFWVKTKVASPAMTFKEQFKTGINYDAIYKTNEGETFTIKMVLDSINSDVMAVKYMSGALVGYDGYDTRKIPGSINLSSYGSDSILLAANVRPLMNNTDTILLDVDGPDGDYMLNFSNVQNITGADYALFVDAYTSSITDLTTTTQYAFSIQSNDTASFGKHRFYIVVGTTGTLPVQLLNFDARQMGTDIMVKWTTAQEKNNDHFEIEYSTTGSDFKTISTVRGQNNSASVHNYSFKHEHPQAVNYYRLKQIDFEGGYTYSTVVVVKLSELKRPIMLYPNPATESITLQSENQLPITKVTIRASDGRVVLVRQPNQSSLRMNISSLQSGIYSVEVLTSNGAVNQLKLVKP